MFIFTFNLVRKNLCFYENPIAMLELVLKMHSRFLWEYGCKKTCKAFWILVFFYEHSRFLWRYEAAKNVLNLCQNSIEFYIDLTAIECFSGVCAEAWFMCLQRSDCNTTFSCPKFMYVWKTKGNFQRMQCFPIIHINIITFLLQKQINNRHIAMNREIDWSQNIWWACLEKLGCWRQNKGCNGINQHLVHFMNRINIWP